MTISHDYFGKLRFDSFDLWSKQMTLNDQPVAVYLSEDSENLPSEEALDKCAHICQNIEQFDQENRELLISYLNDDSKFLDYYLEKQAEFTDSDVLNAFYQGDKSVASFVNLLQAMQINMIISDTKSKVATDYMIDPESSDQVLCVYRKLNGTLMDIGWES